MTYASPTTINATLGLGEVFNYVNVVTDGWVSNLLMIGIYVIILIGYYKARDDFRGGMAVAGYGSFVVGLLFWVGGLISGLIFSMAIGVAVVGTLVLMMDNN